MSDIRSSSKSDVPTGVVSRDFTEVEFVDQYGEKRVIYRQKGQALRVKNTRDTIVHLLDRAAAELMGQRIRAERKRRGWTLEYLHDKAGLVAAQGIAKNRMFEIENGGVGATRRNKQGIRFGTLYALAMAFGCEPGDLLPSCDEVAAKAGVALIDPAPRLGKV